MELYHLVEPQHHTWCLSDQLKELLATVVVSTEPQSLRKHSAEDSRETNERA